MDTVRVKKTIELERDFPGLGDRIRKAREGDKRPLTQICKEAGVSRSYWYHLENEEILGCVTEETIRKIEGVFNISLGVNFNDLK
jgi:transcriptional regulator with XRE-family HTH domain